MPPDELLDTFNRDPWFRSLPEALGRQIIHLSKPRHFIDGACIHRKGDHGATMYGIAAGCVRVTATSAAGREMILTFLQPGHWFGEISMLDKKPRTHDSWAMGEAHLLAFDRSSFQSILAEHPEHAEHFFTLLCQRLRAMMAVYDDSTLLSVADRLGKRLAHLATLFGQVQDDEIAIDVPLSQDDLAFMLGVTRQTIHKEMKVMEERRLLRKTYGKVHVTMELLARYSGY